MTELELTYRDIRAARSRIHGVVRRTPVLVSPSFNEACRGEVFFKCENLQLTGAFKLRGAYNAVAALDERVRARGVVTFSSGNHAQAVALAARLHGIEATILMPDDAPVAKRAATEAYGARVVGYDRYGGDRIALARQLAESTGATLIPPYDHLDVMAGQGTAALELLVEVGELDAVIAPLGGGGLLSGTAVATRAMSPGAAIYGVEPEAGDDARRSLRAGRIVRIDVPRTIADGAQTQFLGKHTFPVLRELVTDVLAVPDASLVAMMRRLFSELKLVVEPTGALAAAAIGDGLLDIAGKRVGVIISGGNIDAVDYARYLAV